MRGARIAGTGRGSTLAPLSTNAAPIATAPGMTDTIKSPEDCTTMIDVRAGVDRTDREIMELLDRRFGYMRAAARIKQDRAAVRDENRKAAVIAAARADAEARGLPAPAVEDIWERLVEASIAYEFEQWDTLRR
jgi:isochorismate pyruvate lyase